MARRKGSKTHSQEEKDRIVEEVLSLVATGVSVRQATAKVGVENQTFHRWMTVENSPYKEQYCFARDMGFDNMAQDIIDLADEEPHQIHLKDGGFKYDPAHCAWKKNQMHARQWTLARISKKYSDKVTLSGDEENPVAIKSITRTIVDPKNDT